MKKRKGPGFVFLIPAVVICLLAVILLVEPEKTGISRAAAYRAAALSVAEEKVIEEEAAGERSYFPVSDQGQWYVPYMDYLYRHGYLTEELVSAKSGEAEKPLTRMEAKALAGQVSESLEKQIRVTKRSGKKPMSQEEFWELFEGICEITEEGAKVKEETLQIYGTPDNTEGAKAWVANTDKGQYRFDGLGLSAYADCGIWALTKEGHILRILEKTSDGVIYSNVWLLEAKEKLIRGQVGDLVRRFETEKAVKKPEDMEHQIADLYVEDGKVQKIVLKKDRISGKVLAVKEDTIEIEGYGEVPVDTGFGVYRLYGEFEVLDPSHILVGYDAQEFVVADGKLCAALLLRPVDADTIRVMIMDTGFQNVTHQKLELEFLSGGVMTYGKKEKRFSAGDKLFLEPGDERLAEGRLVIEPSDESRGIRLLSVERAQGIPVYPGSMEIVEAEDGKGLVLINELYLEEYLKRVVPSEMPPSYEMEALKAQAICARTYARRQISANAYRQYGAHVDDSTRFQVYNNTEGHSATDMAVNETYGKSVYYGDALAETYYFSTSCGHTTSGEAWGADLETVPYLTAKAVRTDGGCLDLTANDAFAEYIKGSFPCFESGYAMFRWNTKVTGGQIAENVPGIGTVTKAAVKERTEGGAARVLVLTGTEGTTEIVGESKIRNALGHPSEVINRKDGSTVTGWANLPSAFFTIEAGGQKEDGTVIFQIYGGGYGHGIGMSQNGAQAMAKNGYSCEEILEFFYEGTEVRE